MKHYFVFFTKLVVSGILLMPLVDSAVHDSFLGEEAAIRFARAYWLSSFEWEDEFVLKDGSVIRRSEHGITIEKDGIIEESQTQKLFITNRNEATLDCPLDLKMQLSRVDFLCKLCQSGLYQETEQDTRDLNLNANWKTEITVINLIINGIKCRTVGHNPTGIYFVSEFDGQINLSKAYTNKYGHKQYSSYLYHAETLHLENKESGRDVCLSAQLSCSEFTKMLFDCGHVMFTSYPPYTIHGMQNEKYAYYYYGDLEKPWWIEEYTAACAAKAKKKREEDKKRNEKEALKRMWEKKHEEHKQLVKAQQEENTRILQTQQNVRINEKKKVTWCLNPLKWRRYFSTRKTGAIN